MRWEIKYTVISGIFMNPDYETYQGYGIRVCRHWRGDTEILGQIEDITTSLPQMEAMVSLINRHRLEYIHLRDIVEDMLVADGG